MHLYTHTHTYTRWCILSDGVHGGDDYSDRVWRRALSFSSVCVFHRFYIVLLLFLLISLPVLVFYSHSRCDVRRDRIGGHVSVEGARVWRSVCFGCVGVSGDDGGSVQGGREEA